MSFRVFKVDENRRMNVNTICLIHFSSIIEAKRRYLVLTKHRQSCNYLSLFNLFENKIE